MAQATSFPETQYYTNANPSYALGESLVGECTWYCNGRALERVGNTSGLSTSGAGSWYGSAPSSQKLSSSTPPVADSVACFSNGHVLYVESTYLVNNFNYIVFSECNWYSDDDPRLSNHQIEVPPDGTDGKLKTMLWNDFKFRGPGNYQGCIVLS